MRARIRLRARKMGPRWNQKKTGKRESELRPVTIVIPGASLAGAPRREGTGKAVGWTQKSSNATFWIRSVTRAPRRTPGQTLCLANFNFDFALSDYHDDLPRVLSRFHAPNRPMKICSFGRPFFPFFPLMLLTLCILTYPKGIGGLTGHRVRPLVCILKLRWLFQSCSVLGRNLP